MVRPTKHDIDTLKETAASCWESYLSDPEDDSPYDIVVLSVGYVELSLDENGLLTDSMWGFGFDEDGDLALTPDWY